MNWLVVTFIFAFAASLALTQMVRAIALRCGVVDHPDGQRKLHRGSVALWGGVAVYLALSLGLFVASHGTFGIDERFAELSFVLIVAAGIVCFCGAIDDCWALTSRVKLLLQLIAVMPIVGLGYSIEMVTVFGVPIDLGWLGVPLTVLWLVGCINSLNLLDGMDGLASMVGALTTAMIAIVAASLGHEHVSVIALVLAGSLCGFLVHNLPPARIFLGDSGSMVIGLALGVLGMQGALKTSTTLAISVPAVIMALPLFDTLLAVVRRKLTGRSFAAADREHIHHRLLDRGMTPWQALCLIGALCLTTGAAATAAAIFRNDSVAWITALALFALAIRLRLFGHPEFVLARALGTRLTSAAWRRLATPWLGSRRPAVRPVMASVEAGWTALLEATTPFEPGRLDLILVQPPLSLQRYGWSASGMVDVRGAWRIVVKLSGPDDTACELRIAGRSAQPLTPAVAEEVTRLLREFAEVFLQCPARAVEPPAVLPLPALEPALQQRAA